MAEIKDKLVERIARRRAEAAAAAAAGAVPASPSAPPAVQPAGVPAAAAAPGVAPVKTFPAESFSPAQMAAIKDLRDAVHLGQNPIEIAKRLTLLVTGRGMQNEIAAAIDKTPVWVSRKMQLLEAPAEIQARIAAGQLSESAYHEERLAALSTRGAGFLRRSRESRGKVSKTAMRNIALLFQDLAGTHGLAPIRIPESVSLSELEHILNTRAGEIRAAVLGSK